MVPDGTNHLHGSSNWPAADLPGGPFFIGDMRRRVRCSNSAARHLLYFGYPQSSTVSCRSRQKDGSFGAEFARDLRVVAAARRQQLRGEECSFGPVARAEHSHKHGHVNLGSAFCDAKSACHLLVGESFCKQRHDLTRRSVNLSRSAERYRTGATSPSARERRPASQEHKYARTTDPELRPRTRYPAAACK
jgi:hypothetical protein